MYDRDNIDLIYFYSYVCAKFTCMFYFIMQNLFVNILHFIKLQFLSIYKSVKQTSESSVSSHS